MSREAHVRFDGSGEGQVLPATLLYRSGLYFLAKRIDEHLVRWAMQKFQRLRNKPTETRAWLAAVRQHHPRLFAHWYLLPHTNGRPVGAG